MDWTLVSTNLKNKESELKRTKLELASLMNTSARYIHIYIYMFISMFLYLYRYV